MRDVMLGDWRFRRSFVAQLLSSAAICLRYLVWRVEKADADISFAANRLLEGGIRVLARARSRRRSDRRLAFSALSCGTALQQRCYLSAASCLAHREGRR